MLFDHISNHIYNFYFISFIPPNANKNALKCTQRRRKNAHKNTYAQLMHHNNNVTLMCRYLKSCTTRLFSLQLFHGSWRPLLVLCMWSTVYRWIPLTDRL